MFMTHKKAVIATCFVAVLWSLAGLNIKLIEWPPFAIAGGRSIVSLLLLTPTMLKIKGKKLTAPVVLGGIFYAIFCCCFVVSTKLTTSAVAIFMQYTAPVYVAVLSGTFLGERITKIDIISIITVFMGMLLFFLDDLGGGSFVGNVVAVFNGITLAGLAICLRLQKNAHPIMSVFCGNAITVIVCLPFVFSAGMPDTNSLFFLVLLGMQVAITYTIYGMASRSLSGLEVVLLPVIDPILNPVWVYLMLGEKIGPMSILGGIIVLASITGRMIYGMKIAKQAA